MMKLFIFILCCTLFSSIAAFVVPDGFTELKNNSILPPILHKYDLCESVICYNEGMCDIKTGICDCRNTRYKGENCKELSKRQCEKIKEKCFTSDGKCTTIDSGETIECLCSEGQRYTETDGCKNLCESVQCYNEGMCDIKTGICDCSKTGYTGENCKEISEKQCEQLKEKCFTSDGKCTTIDSGETIECLCSEGQWYTDDEGCKVTDEVCEQEKAKCTLTGGSCSVASGTSTFVCNCKGSLIYDDNKGCDVTPELCESVYPKCKETAGTCVADHVKSTAKCSCPGDIAYSHETGCNVIDEVCEQQKPKCTLTGGSCSVARGTNTLVCSCKGSLMYDDIKGCDVTPVLCESVYPKCKETAGTCVADHFKNTAKCLCPGDITYSQETGCNVPAVPQNLRATCYTNTSICLNWDEPPALMVHILFYKIHWFNSSGSGWERSVSNTTSHTVRHLAPFVKYSFRVAAYTKTGTGKMSENLDIRTAVGVPHAPRNLTVTRMTNSTAELIWNEPLISTGPIITYRVHWQNSSSTGEEETRSTATFYTVRNLTPNVNYTFKVKALTEAGPGEWSGRVIGQTKNGDKCSNVTCQNGGKCIIKGGKAVCKCTDKYTGNFCETDLTSLDDPDDNIFVSVFFKNRSLSTDSKLDFHFSRKETSNRTITQLLLRLNSESVVRPPDDKCSLSSCKNGGTCEVKNEKAVCTCADEYTGDYCEKSKCSLIKCQNNGKCHLKKGKEICACTDNYAGEYCENHKCSLIECKNGGKCEVKYGKAVCICPDSYTGDYCETDKCSLVGCKNGGKCVIINGKGICNCLDNYTGDLCETDKCSLIRCHNGGKCDIKNGKAVCVCNDKHIGDFCEIDKCSLIRCLNEGKCEIKNQKAVCICSDEFTGDYCEKRTY